MFFRTQIEIMYAFVNNSSEINHLRPRDLAPRYFKWFRVPTPNYAKMWLNEAKEVSHQHARSGDWWPDEGDGQTLA